jgi:hypothetical protein
MVLRGRLEGKIDLFAGMQGFALDGGFPKDRALLHVSWE